MNGSSWKVKHIPSYKLGIKNWISNFFLAEISCQERKEFKLFKMKQQQQFNIFSGPFKVDKEKHHGKACLQAM